MHTPKSLRMLAHNVRGHTRERPTAAPLIIGVLALLACAIAAHWQLKLVLRSYLLAWLLFLGFALGSFGGLALHNLAGGDWGRPVRRYFEASLRTLPALSVLFIPLALGTAQLFPWTATGGEIPGSALASKGWYLNAAFFWGRAFAFLLAWNILAILLTARGWQARKLTTVSVVALLVYAVTMTLAAVDWIASLTPEWSSTALGLIVMTAQGLGAFALAVTAVTMRPATAPQAHRTVLTDQNCGDLGNLLLTFVMTWMYLAFVQFLIIWAEDLPREIVWYLPRAHTSWWLLSASVVTLQFVIPFGLLLFRPLKRNPRRLAAIAILLLLAQWLYVSWLVLPSLEPSGLAYDWTDFAATLGIGGVWLHFWLRSLVRGGMR
jgi:hypothetical protein